MLTDVGKPAQSFCDNQLVRHMLFVCHLVKDMKFKCSVSPHIFTHMWALNNKFVDRIDSVVY